MHLMRCSRWVANEHDHWHPCRLPLRQISLHPFPLFRMLLRSVAPAKKHLAAAPLSISNIKVSLSYRAIAERQACRSMTICKRPQEVLYIMCARYSMEPGHVHYFCTLNGSMNLLYLLIQSKARCCRKRFDWGEVYSSAMARQDMLLPTISSWYFE